MEDPKQLDPKRSTQENFGHDWSLRSSHWVPVASALPSKVALDSGIPDNYADSEGVHVDKLKSCLSTSCNNWPGRVGTNLAQALHWLTVRWCEFMRPWIIYPVSLPTKGLIHHSYRILAFGPVKYFKFTLPKGFGSTIEDDLSFPW